MHAEQFRLWEALEVGALPVILDEPQHAHLEELGLTVPKACGHILIFTSAAYCAHQLHDSWH